MSFKKGQNRKKSISMPKEASYFMNMEHGRKKAQASI